MVTTKKKRARAVTRAEFEGMRSCIGALETRQDVHVKRIDALEDSKKVLDARITALDGRVTSLEERASQAEAGLIGAWARHDKANARITALENAAKPAAPAPTECPRVGDCIQSEAQARALPVGSHTHNGLYTKEGPNEWVEPGGYGYSDGYVIGDIVTRVGPAVDAPKPAASPKPSARERWWRIRTKERDQMARVDAVYREYCDAMDRLDAGGNRDVEMKLAEHLGEVMAAMVREPGMLERPKWMAAEHEARIATELWLLKKKHQKAAAPPPQEARLERAVVDAAMERHTRPARW